MSEPWGGDESLRRELMDERFGSARRRGRERPLTPAEKLAAGGRTSERAQANKRRSEGQSWDNESEAKGHVLGGPRPPASDHFRYERKG